MVKGLPNKLFLVKVPTIATLSDFEINEVGVPVSYLNNNIEDDKYGDLSYIKVEEEMGIRQLSTVMLNINRIIDIYCNGYPIYIVNKQDSIEIFNILDEYLINQTKTTNSLNKRIVTDIRIRDIDRFITEILGYQSKVIADNYTKELTRHGFSVNSDIGLMPLPRAIPTRQNIPVEDTGVIIAKPILNYINPTNNTDNYNNTIEKRVIQATVGDNSNYTYIQEQLPVPEITRKPLFKNRF